jgi:hypothetical protein
MVSNWKWINDKLFLIVEYDRLSNYPKAIRRLKDNQMNYKIIPDSGHAINYEQADLIIIRSYSLFTMNELQPREGAMIVFCFKVCFLY